MKYNNGDLININDNVEYHSERGCTRDLYVSEVCNGRIVVLRSKHGKKLIVVQDVNLIKFIRRKENDEKSSFK
jgi:hypothetical protein